MAKAKGTIVVPTVRFLRTRRDEARARLPERLHRYLEETLQTGQWYPEEDFLELLRTMAALLPGSGPALYEQLGRAAAAEHLAGVYQHLHIDAHDPFGLTRRTFALWSTMHDTGRLRAVEPGPHGTRFVLEDYAHPCVEMCATLTGYLTETLRLGGLEAQLRKTACVVDGAARCTWEASWREDAAAGPS